MAKALRRIARDLRDRRFIEAYSASLVAFVLAIITLIADVVPAQLRWAAILAGVGLLVFRVTIPQTSGLALGELLQDRFAFDTIPLSERLANAKEVWVFAPTGVNLLSAHTCELLRTGLLSKAGGVLRIVVLDPAHEAALEIASHQLDDSLDYPIQDLRTSLNNTLNLLAVIASWPIRGSFEYRLARYNPGFSLVVIDPNSRNGHTIVEFHGFHNEATSSRMHIEIGHGQSDHWYPYWVDQFARIWAASKPRSA